MSKTANLAVVRRERALSSFVPFSACLNSTTLVTRSSDLVRTWRIEGLAFETADPDDIERDKESLNTFIRATGSEHVAIYQHTVQRKVSAPNLLPSYSNDYARHVSAQYQAGLAGSDLFISDLYITIVYRYDTSKLRGVFNRQGRTVAQLKHQRGRNLDALDRIGQQLESTLSAYGPTVLGEYENGQGGIISEPLTFQNYLLSGFWQPVLKPTGTPLYNYLGSASVYVGTDVVEVRRPNRERFCQVIEIKEFASTTLAGIMNVLMYQDVEFVSCANFCTMQRHDAANKLGTQVHHLNNTGSPELADDVRSIAIDLEDGKHSLGELNYTVKVFAGSVQAVRDDVATLIGEFENMGYIAVTSGLATDSAFFSQVPGNFSDRTRIAHVTSQNFAGFASMHNFHAGKSRGNPWGNAVMPLKTDSNRIAFLNLHNANDPADQRGKMLPASVTLIGQSGSGKTTVLNKLTCALQQFNTRERPLLSLTLDIKQGSRKTIEALGGVYSELKNGQSTGYNPFKMANEPNNLVFLDILVTYLCSQNGNTVTTADEKNISSAVRATMALPVEHRGFTTLLQNMASDGSEDCVTLRLAKWCADDGTGRVGHLAWALDNNTDTLDFDQNTVFGIDGSDLLDNPTTRTPVLMYLLHRVKQVLGTRRVCLPVDEAFKWLDDASIGPWIGETLTTIRSKDGLMILATQMPSSVLQCSVGPAILQQTNTFLFLRNPRARWDEYERFGLTEAEFTAMQDMPKHHFLLKQDSNSKTATLDLSGFCPDDLSILAGEQAA